MNIKLTLGLLMLTISMLTLAACGSDNGKSDGDGSACGGGDDTAATRVEVPAEYKGKAAPEGFKADLEAGKKLFEPCAACHGAAGKGDVAVYATIKPKPSNLTVDGLADDYMYFRIVKGMGVVNGSIMTGHPKADGVSDADYETAVWNIIEYTKSLK